MSDDFKFYLRVYEEVAESFDGAWIFDHNSEIEKAFLAYHIIKLGRYDNFHTIEYYADKCRYPKDFKESCEYAYAFNPTCPFDNIHSVYSQFKVRGYTVDFMFLCRAVVPVTQFTTNLRKQGLSWETIDLIIEHKDNFFKVFVELDGHDFHEKTKEQVDKRNERDAILSEEGFVYHISGSKFYNNPDETIFELEEFLSRLAGKKADEIESWIRLSHTMSDKKGEISESFKHTAKGDKSKQPT